MCCNRMGCLVAGLQRLQCLQELIRRNPIQSRHPQWTATIFSRMNALTSRQDILQMVF